MRPKISQKRLAELNRRYTEDKIRSTRLNKAAPDLLAALEELVTLKDLKDAEGKTPDYERRQPLAWEAARAALSKAKGEGA